MKKTLLIAAAAMMASPAMASKARLEALGNSAHLKDIREILTNPAEMFTHGDFATFEMGAKSAAAQGTTAQPHAEGGFSRGMGDTKYGFYLGNRASWVSDVRDTGYLIDENPINLYYAAKSGDLAWGVGLNYSNSDVKSTRSKASSTGLLAGVVAADWDAYVNLGLTNTYKVTDASSGNATTDFKGKSAVVVGGRYVVDTLTYHGSYTMNGGKNDVTNGNESTINNMSVGVVNSMKADGVDFFYGATYAMNSRTDKAGANETKVTSTSLPVLAGVEADAASWLVLRASVSQNVLLGTEKTDVNGTGEADTIGNNTTVNAGLGMKFGKLMLDGTFSKASGATATGALNGNDFLSNASLTYMF
jgi:hypothetical protein